MIIALILTGLFVLLILLWVIMTGNAFIAKNTRVQQTESSIFVMLKQRNDMIPNLVASVQTYMGHESATLTKIAELRSLYQQAASQQEQMEIGAQLSKSLAEVKVAVEAYPELKANAHFKTLNASIEEMEYQLQAARRTFNAAIADYNNFVLMFPSSIIAAMKKYSPRELITIPESEHTNVNVSALFRS
ncbi:MAG: LemA family protein [Tannerellaceae bacterium]|jgi:LemA protein|nr:LemA family protein [Tannerellaceae bacterium]